MPSSDERPYVAWQNSVSFQTYGVISATGQEDSVERVAPRET